MSGRIISSGAQAEHCRELASWTSDERTQNILLEMARELEAQEAAEPATPDEEARPSPPRSLS
jgi:hypothetical protein